MHYVVISLWLQLSYSLCSYVSLRRQTSLRKCSAFSPSKGSAKPLLGQQRITIQSAQCSDEAGLDFTEAKGAVIVFKGFCSVHM